MYLKKRETSKMKVLLLAFLLIGVFLPLAPVFAADAQVIYENDFESDEAAVEIGENNALEFTVAGNANESWVPVFQHELYFEYADALYSGAILSFDLFLPVDVTFEGLLKGQAVTKMGDNWSWTQSGTIADIGIGNFTDEGNGYKKATVSIPFGAEIETTPGLKSIVPCLAASNCNYTGLVYLDNVTLTNSSPPTSEPVLTIIYENNFESDGAAVDIGGNKVLEFTVAGDPDNSWVTVFQHELYFDYADSLNTGSTLSFDLFLPVDAAYAGLLKAQAVTKMGDAWTWTQSNTIADIGIDNFTGEGTGYKKATVSIPFGAEIETVQGLKSIVPSLAASNCDYNGLIYLDNVTLANLSSTPGEGPELPPVDPIILTFDSEEDIASWTDGGNYDYNGGLIIGYDNTKQALQLDVDYSANSSSAWSEAKVQYTLPEPLQTEGYNRFSFDFIYDPANRTAGSFSVKFFAGSIDVSTAVPEAEDFGNGLKKAVVVLTFPSQDNNIYNFVLGLVGSNTDYAGSVYIDNVTFSQADDGYVTAELSVEEQMPITAYADSITANGQTIGIMKNIKLVDDNAFAYTAQLAAYLEAVGKSDSVLFGHQNDISHKAGNKGLSDSDTQDMTGSIAAVMGIDTLSLTGNELAEANWDDPLENRVAAVAALTAEAAGRGAIITLSAHMPNFEIIGRRVQNSLDGTADPSDLNSIGILSDGHYNFAGYTPGTLTGNIVARIMPGRDLNYLYVDYLDMIAAYGKALEADNVSVLFRPFHEGTGSWFWWGRAFCDKEAFKNLYKYTVEYLRDVKGVHNFLYVYGPGGEAQSTEEYALRYPGDDFVDMVGFDMYHNNPAEGDRFIAQLTKELAIVEQFATEHNKLFAVTETGHANNGVALLRKNNQRPDWYNEVLDAVSPSTASYFLVWANWGPNASYYTPYVVSKTETTMKGHEMLDYFIDYYNDPRSVFAAQMADFTLLAATPVENTNVTGFFTSPVSGSRILEPADFEASITNAPDSAEVIFIASNKNGDMVQEIPAAIAVNNRYNGTLTSEQLSALGATLGTMSVSVDGIVYDTINLKYNMPEPVIDPTEVDSFEYYYGDTELLNVSWSINSGPDCSIIPGLSTAGYGGNYSLEFNYSLIDGGYAGITKSMNGADWSGEDALQLWTVSDGLEQKVVVQITSGSNVFEIYLNEYDEYNEANYPVLVTIPFTSFVGRDDAAAVFDASDIQSFGLWCNAIVPEDADPASYVIDSVLYYDEIMAVTSGAAEILFEEIIPNRSPVIDEISGKTSNEGTAIEFTVSASDPDGDALVLSAGSLPAGAAFIPESGVFSWTPDYQQAGEYTVTFTASDGELTDTGEVVIIVNNYTAIQYAQNMIDTIFAMELDKGTKKYLIKKLNIVRWLLKKNKPCSALVVLKSFIRHAGKNKWISEENANILLEDSAQLCVIIIDDYPNIKSKKWFRGIRNTCKNNMKRKRIVK